MVNFRYHIVSLIAVFVALCLGVVLGAGPLQSRISSGLMPTTSTASSNEALAQAQNNSKIEARAVAELAQGRLAGSLNGVSVAIVTVPGSDSSDVASMRDTLGTAGAQVVGEVELTNTWLSADSATFRNTLATPLASHLTGLAGDAGAEAVIGQAIVTSLTQSGSEPDLVKQILTGGDTPVMRMTKDPQGGAQAIVVVAPRGNTSGKAWQRLLGMRLPVASSWVMLRLIVLLSQLCVAGMFRQQPLIKSELRREQFRRFWR